MGRRGIDEQSAPPETGKSLGTRKVAIGKHGAPAENKGNMQTEANMQRHLINLARTSKRSESPTGMDLGLIVEPQGSSQG